MVKALRERRRPGDMSLRRWADLPQDLLSLIAEKLQTHIDILRLRSVCASWRSSIAPIRRSPLFPVNLPTFMYANQIFMSWLYNYKKPFILSESIIYRLDPPASNSSPENSGSWLLRIKETSVGLTRFENPLSKRFDRHPPSGFPKVLNLLDFRVTELSRVYHVSLNSSMDVGIARVALSSRPCSSSDDYVLMAVNCIGQLGSILLGGDYKWTKFQDYDLIIFRDVINFNGKFYAMDTYCRILVFEELSLQLIEDFRPTMPAPNGCGDSRLVKLSGDLLLVYRKRLTIGRTAFRCFKLNQELRDLEEVNSFGDQVLFLGDQFSFSVSTLEFTGLEPNCLYFAGRFPYNIVSDGVIKNLGKISVFKLGYGPVRFYPENSKIFWPPPAWLQPGPSASS